jgi:SAM-dependent methyltransferase
MTTTTTPATPDLDSIKSRQQVTWSAGDYAVIGVTLQLVGESLCEALDLSAGERVLDVAAGNGNVSLAAARRRAEVTASDYVPALLAGTAARAAVEQLPITTQEADAEALPFEDGTFDVVTSSFGVMFTPDQDRAAAELRRVCRSGGRIGLANWTPDGFVGAMFKVIGRHVPPPAGIRSPLVWGTHARLADLFDGASSIDAATRQHVFRFRDARDWVDTFRSYYGPTVKAFGALDADGAAALDRDLVELCEANNVATDGTLKIPADYLEIVVTNG